MRAVAYVNFGRVIADCPRQFCASAAKLEPRQTLFHCVECKQVAEVEWAPALDGILAVLERRPVPATRNWAPAGHRQSVAVGWENGQTVQDLIAENREHGVAA